MAHRGVGGVTLEAIPVGAEIACRLFEGNFSPAQRRPSHGLDVLQPGATRTDSDGAVLSVTTSPRGPRESQKNTCRDGSLSSSSGLKRFGL